VEEGITDADSARRRLTTCAKAPLTSEVKTPMAAKSSFAGSTETLGAPALCRALGGG